MNACDPKKKRYKAFVKHEKEKIEPMNVQQSQVVQYTAITQELDFVSEN